MGSSFNLNSMLTGNLDEDAATITEVSRQIRKVMSMNKKLTGKVPISIKDRSQSTRARAKSLLRYALDSKTVDLLEQHHDTWLLAPALFDEYVTSLQWAAMDPWTRTFSRYLETEPVNRADKVTKHPQYLGQIKVANTGQFAIPTYDSETLKGVVASMLDAASHYENWKIGLGVRGGVALVLGSEHGETSWTKLMGKKEEKYIKAIRRLKEVDLPRHAEKYANLEKALVDHKVKLLLAEAQTNSAMTLANPSATLPPHGGHFQHLG